MRNGGRSARGEASPRMPSAERLASPATRATGRRSRSEAPVEHGRGGIGYLKARRAAGLKPGWPGGALIPGHEDGRRPRQRRDRRLEGPEHSVHVELAEQGRDESRAQEHEKENGARPVYALSLSSAKCSRRSARAEGIGGADDDPLGGGGDEHRFRHYTDQTSSESFAQRHHASWFSARSSIEGKGKDMVRS